MRQEATKPIPDELELELQRGAEQLFRLESEPTAELAGSMREAVQKKVPADVLRLRAG